MNIDDEYYLTKGHFPAKHIDNLATEDPPADRTFSVVYVENNQYLYPSFIDYTYDMRINESFHMNPLVNGEVDRRFWEDIPMHEREDIYSGRIDDRQAGITWFNRLDDDYLPSDDKGMYVSPAIGSIYCSSEPCNDFNVIGDDSGKVMDPLPYKKIVYTDCDNYVVQTYASEVVVQDMPNLIKVLLQTNGLLRQVTLTVINCPNLVTPDALVDDADASTSTILSEVPSVSRKYYRRYNDVNDKDVVIVVMRF